MNEKLKELAEKAQKIVGYTDGGYTEIKALDQEKFAELIVRECASICDQQGRASWNDDRKAQARLDRDLIKKHFGVEE